MGWDLAGLCESLLPFDAPVVQKADKDVLRFYYGQGNLQTVLRLQIELLRVFIPLSSAKSKDMLRSHA